MKTILVWFLIGMNLAIIAPYVWEPIANDGLYQYSDMSSLAHPHEDVCIATGNHMNFEVKVEFVEFEDHAIGRWIPSSYTIQLESTDLDTVAHEVSHMVDTVLQDKGIKKGGELEAYLQGSFTSCVYQIVTRRVNISPI